MAAEHGQLQLEQSTWAMHSRIELIAAQALQMQVPDATRIQVVSPDFKRESNAVQLPELAKPGVLKPGVLKPGTAMPKSVTPDSKTDALKAPAAKIVQTGAQL